MGLRDSDSTSSSGYGNIPPSRLSPREYYALSYYAQRPGIINARDKSAVDRLADCGAVNVYCKESKARTLKCARASMLGIRMLRQEMSRRARKSERRTPIFC
jgi:hypothetical protein